MVQPCQLHQQREHQLGLARPEPYAVTNSFHWNGAVGWEEPIRTGWATGYRSAAVHWGEGRKGNYYVIGAHFEWDTRYGEHFLGYTPTTGCNLGFSFRTGDYERKASV